MKVHNWVCSIGGHQLSNFCIVFLFLYFFLVLYFCILVSVFLYFLFLYISFLVILYLCIFVFWWAAIVQLERGAITASSAFQGQVSCKSRWRIARIGGNTHPALTIANSQTKVASQTILTDTCQTELCKPSRGGETLQVSLCVHKSLLFYLASVWCWTLWIHCCI